MPGTPKIKRLKLQAFPLTTTPATAIRVARKWTGGLVCCGVWSAGAFFVFWGVCWGLLVWMSFLVSFWSAWVFGLRGLFGFLSAGTFGPVGALGLFFGLLCCGVGVFSCARGGV